MTLEDKVVLVTGTANGLGAGIVEALLARGARVALADVDASTLKVTQARLDPSGERTVSMVTDVTDEAAIGRFVSGAVEAFDRVDALVNNAGIIVMGAALDERQQAFDGQFAVNVVGLFACCKAAARQMIAQASGGAIVNIASNAGKVGFPAMVGYNASKAAVINLNPGRRMGAPWHQRQCDMPRQRRDADASKRRRVSVLAIRAVSRQPF